MLFAGLVFTFNQTEAGVSLMPDGNEVSEWAAWKHMGLIVMETHQHKISYM